MKYQSPDMKKDKTKSPNTVPKNTHARITENKMKMIKKIDNIWKTTQQKRNQLISDILLEQEDVEVYAENTLTEAQHIIKIDDDNNTMEKVLKEMLPPDLTLEIALHKLQE